MQAVTVGVRLDRHGRNPKVAGRADDYIGQVCIPALHAAHAEGLIDAVDAFCEGIAFSPAQVQRLFAVARAMGLLDHHITLILAYCTFLIPYVMWLMRGFFKALPVEEKQRLQQHLDYFKTCLKKEPLGRKLNFIAQEMGREMNTMGVKSNYFPMQQAVVQMKEKLEQIKEQVLNLV